jgi:8-oxo-dGTP pyrophosphatase MutT (NUDIX family)
MEIQRPKTFFNWPEGTKRVFKGKIFEVYQWEQPLFDGGVATFENLKRPDTAEVIPILPDGHILLINQEQPTTGQYLSTIAGRMEEDEEPLAAIQRELLEETGYEAVEWSLWDAYQPVRKIDWAVYTFIAKGLHKVAEPNLDGGEKIDLYPVSLDEFLRLALRGDIVGGQALVEICEAYVNPEKRVALQKKLSI